MPIHVSGLGLPIQTIFGIGRNYAAHAKELGNAVPPEPIIFLKPISSIVFSGGSIRIPKGIGRVDYEGEMVIALGRGGKDIPVEKALSHVAGYGLGIDVTARDLQGEAKKKGQPWALAKGCDTFAVLGDFVAADKVKPEAISFSLELNGQIKQRGNSADMETSIAGLVSYLSRYFTLAAGDLIFSGTPEGVGPLAPGDKIHMEMAGTSARLDVGVEG
jgi:2-keto-4-pentenoate hydratase/2-oxohepta-3-ene-1,7-dioic acid hydratase in catechol pathway